MLIDARGFGGEGQGTVTYIKGIYNALFENYGKNYDLFFAGYDFEATKESLPFLEKSNFVKLYSRSRGKLFFVELPAAIDKYNIEFAHFQYVVPFIKNCEFIVTTHDLLFNDFPESFSTWYSMKRNFLFKNALSRSDIRLTVSDYSKERIAEHYNLDENRIVVTPNAVREEYLADFDKKEAQKFIKEKFGTEDYLLYVSRIEPRKNQQLLIDAYREMNLGKKGISLVFIGNDTLGSVKIVAEIRKLQKDFPGLIHWFSGITDSEMLSFYRAARLFVYPSTGEGFGIPPIEAAATGLPTLCSNVTAMRDFDFFGEACFSPFDLGELKLKMALYLENPPEEKELLRIKKIIKSRYSWDYSASLIHGLVSVKKNRKRLEKRAEILAAA